jgi:non-ribosomal peptide synthetase component F
MMFNTGDIVRWREAGSLDTFGRLDDQVKIKVRSYCYSLYLF